MDATDHTFVRTLTHFQEAMQRMRQLEDENRDLSRQVDGLERMVQVLQAFSLLASRRLAELERATGLPTPPAGPPPATPAPALANICLLYTSPSPRDLSTSRMPSSA